MTEILTFLGRLPAARHCSGVLQGVSPRCLVAATGDGDYGRFTGPGRDGRQSCDLESAAGFKP